MTSEATRHFGPHALCPYLKKDLLIYHFLLAPDGGLTRGSYLQNKQINSSVGVGLRETLGESGALILAGNLEFFQTLILQMEKLRPGGRSPLGRQSTHWAGAREAKERPRAGSSGACRRAAWVQWWRRNK